MTISGNNRGWTNIQPMRPWSTHNNKLAATTAPLPLKEKYTNYDQIELRFKGIVNYANVVNGIWYNKEIGIGPNIRASNT